MTDSGKRQISWRETGFDCYLGGGIYQNLCTECRVFCLSVEKSYVLVATANQPGESSVVSNSYPSKPCLFSSYITLSSWLIQLDRLQTELSGRSSTTKVTVKWSEKCVKYKYGSTFLVFLANKTQAPPGFDSVTVRVVRWWWWGVVLCFIFACFCFSLSLLTLGLNSRGSAIHGISSKFVEINLPHESYMDRWTRSEHQLTPSRNKCSYLFGWCLQLPSKEIATKKTCSSCFVSDPSSGQEMVFDLNLDGRSTLKRKMKAI